MDTTISNWHLRIQLKPLLPDCAHFTLLPPGKRKIGYQKATFTADRWEINIDHAVTPLTIYNVSANYKHGEIEWRGNVADGCVKEEKYAKA